MAGGIGDKGEPAGLVGTMVEDGRYIITCASSAISKTLSGFTRDGVAVTTMPSLGQ